MLRNGGNLDSSYKPRGTGTTGLLAIDYTAVFPGKSKFIDLREIDGSIAIRKAAGTKTKVYPVWFKNMSESIICCSALYAHSYDKATKEAISLGWKPLNLNQNVYYGYFKVQYINRDLDYYKHQSENFLDGSGNNSWAVPDKSYKRWVTWRYILLSGFFTK